MLCKLRKHTISLINPSAEIPPNLKQDQLPSTEGILSLWFTYIESWSLISLKPSEIITGPPTHSVGGQYCFARWRLSSSPVTLHGGTEGGFTSAGKAMTSCRFQSNYSFTVTLHGGSVVLRPVRATSCFNMQIDAGSSSTICRYGNGISSWHSKHSRTKASVYNNGSLHFDFSLMCRRDHAVLTNLRVFISTYSLHTLNGHFPGNPELAAASIGAKERLGWLSLPPSVGR